MIGNKEIEERITKCEKILSANPGSQIFASLAEAHRKNGDLDTAFDVCQRGLKSHPKYGSAHVVMAKINIDKELYDWAESEVEKAAKHGANSHAIETLRCEILLSKGEINQAISRLDKQLKFDPQNVQLQRLLQRAKKPNAKSKSYGVVSSGIAKKKINPTPDPFLNKSSGNGVSSSFSANATTSAKILSPDPLLGEPMQSQGKQSFSISDVFDTVHAIEGVYASFLLGVDGTALEARWDGIGSEDEHIVFATTTADQCRDALVRMPYGKWNIVLVDTPRLALYLVSNGDERLAFFAGEKANRNRMRVAINRAFEKYTDRKGEQGA